MSSDEVAIRVSDVTKHYLLYARPEDRLKQMIVPRLQRAIGRPPKTYYRTFAALNGVSFDVRRGETVGIIGRNGCGKSTLLQIVCGILRPSSGAVAVNGRVAALLELGAGFNPDFTGRENVFLNASILGLTRAETEKRFDAIARFADIGQFIDQPVKTYSSGMYVRLAFSVATNVDPDILVIDEALAVGDEAFQRKCFARIEDIRDRGGTILFVSHGAQTIIQLCDRALLFDRGEKILEGRPKSVVGQYHRLANASAQGAAEIRAQILAMREAPAETAETPQAVAIPAAPAQERTRAPGAGTAPASGGAPATPAEKRAAPADMDHPGSAKPGHSAMADRIETAPAATDRDGGNADYFDPNLKSQSVVEFEQRGARIHDVRITTLDGKPVNVLRTGKRYVLSYSVDFEKCPANLVGFGFSVRSISGVAIGGIQTFNSTATRSILASLTTTRSVKFTFTCSMLPGVYLINAGVLGHVQASQMVLHRIQDSLLFRVVIEDAQLETGLVDLGVVYSVS